MPSSYPGYVLRQHLIDYCQDQVARNAKDLDLLRKDMAALETSDEPSEDALMVYAEITKIMGVQLGLRGVCEWAKDHLAPPVEVNVSTGPGADPRDIGNIE
jgi:hypothetical protein